MLIRPPCTKTDSGTRAWKGELKKDFEELKNGLEELGKGFEESSQG